MPVLFFGKRSGRTPGPPRKPEPQGDFGGPYGYGHPAHRPDPAASYGFRRNLMRLLPVKPTERWR